MLLNPVSRFYIIEIELGHRIDTDTWTQAVAPNLNCWYITHSEGKPSKVEEKIAAGVKSLYTELATLELCHTVAKSWYWDSPNNRLYVHTTNSNTPHDNYLVQSYFWVYYTSKSPTMFNSQQYISLLNEKSISGVTQAVSNYERGGTEISINSIKMINNSGYFDAKLSDYIWEAKRIIGRVGKVGDSYSDLTVFLNAWTGGNSLTDEEFTVEIRDLREVVL